MPSVFAAGPVLGSVFTTVPLTTKSILSAITRTSSALVQLPLASGFFTALLGVLSDTSCVVPPVRRFTSHVPSSVITKYRYSWPAAARLLPPNTSPQYARYPVDFISLHEPL